MFATLIGLFKNLFGLIDSCFTWLDHQDFKKLGQLEAEQVQHTQEEQDAQIAKNIDAQPVSRNKSDILAGLRSNQK